MTRTDHDGPHTPPHTTFRALFWLVAGLLCLGLTHPLANAEELDSIVAIVNDDVVVQSEVSREMAQTIPNFRNRAPRYPRRSSCASRCWSG